MCACSLGHTTPTGLAGAHAPSPTSLLALHSLFSARPPRRPRRVSPPGAPSAPAPALHQTVKDATGAARAPGRPTPTRKRTPCACGSPRRRLLLLLPTLAHSIPAPGPAAFPQPGGGAREDRTPDLLRARQALSRLSYGPSGSVVGLGGIEPPTSPLSGVRSNQLSYRPGRLPSVRQFDAGARAGAAPAGVKGGDPAAGSPTATLLRLHPSHQPHLRRRLPCG